MIDPRYVTKFDRTEIELQEFYLFCTCVAGKAAYIQSQKLEQFLQPAWMKGLTPFEYIDKLVLEDKLLYMLFDVKLGQYKRLYETFKESTSLSLDTCSVHDLENIPGIGPKTSRFFLIHSRPNQRYAVLDTHILSWLRENVQNTAIPSSTPQSRSRYSELENIFLKICDKNKVNPEVFDLQIWNERAKQINLDAIQKGR